MRRDEASGGGGPETEPLLSCLLALSGKTAVLNFIFYYYLLFIYLVFCQKQISPIIILFFCFSLHERTGAEEEESPSIGGTSDSGGRL